ncbi:MAG: hypothetical protein Q8K63_10400, partial [Acidimicrobiales bacterium]|nr:hypothetical protein [Acidimicrobiales bacterium]
DLDITAAVAQTAPTTLSFSHPTEFSPTYPGKHVGATDTGLALASVSVAGNAATAALAPLLEDALPATLATLDRVLDPLIRPLLRSLGVQVSQTDVAALGIYPSASSCGGHPRLAK